MSDETALNIYTDGSSLSRPRTGGIGIVFVIVNDQGDDEIVNEFEYPGYKQATNNEMELEACIKALEEALDRNVFDKYKTICIYTDSRYIVNNYKNAIFVWPTTGWTGRGTGRPILHVEQWKRLVRLIKRAKLQRRVVEIAWIKGHSKNKYNKLADKLAKKSAKNPLNRPLSVVSVRKKKTSKALEAGSVPMQGQTLAIRVITTERLREHKLWRYKYEVMSVESKFHGNVDITCSPISLRDGHCYSVVMNDDSDNPRITSLLAEIDCNETQPLKPLVDAT